MTTWGPLGYADADVELDDELAGELAAEGAFEREPSEREWSEMEDAMVVDAERVGPCVVRVFGENTGAYMPCWAAGVTTCMRCHKAVCEEHRRVVEFGRPGDKLRMELCVACESDWRELDHSDRNH